MYKERILTYFVYFILFRSIFNHGNNRYFDVHVQFDFYYGIPSGRGLRERECRRTGRKVCNVLKFERNTALWNISRQISKRFLIKEQSHRLLSKKIITAVTREIEI